MKLYTYCSNSLSEVKLDRNHGVKKEEYTYQEYLSFLKEAQRYYVHLYHSYYETDMSDHSSGSSSDHFSINYHNMIISDHKLFGVLVKTNSSFPKYFILKLSEKKLSIDLDGGYNSNAFTWTLMDNDLSNHLTLIASFKYILIVENKRYEGQELKYYEREIIAPIQKDFIVKDNLVTHVKYLNHKIDLSSDNEVKIKDNTTVKVIKIDEEFLNKNILDVSYRDFYYQKYTLIK